MFFAHVAKQQPYNRDMFRDLISNEITLIDYEYLTTDEGQRVVAFGRYAGLVGAYNGLRARGIRTNGFELKPAHKCRDLEEMWAGLSLIDLNNKLKILVTGDGRVAHGAIETLQAADIEQVTPEEFVTHDFDVPVFTHLGPSQYTRHKEGKNFNYDHFLNYPSEYESAFLPFTRVTDILITGHFWDPRAPVFFSADDMKKPDFRISVIADISCDIKGPIPSTIRATTISDPFYGYNPHLGIEEPAFLRPSNITVMSIDNLPGELPRDASHDFGKQLIGNVLDNIFSGTESSMIKRATILDKGKLTTGFDYLKDYLNE